MQKLRRSFSASEETSADLPIRMAHQDVPFARVAIKHGQHVLSVLSEGVGLGATRGSAESVTQEVWSHHLVATAEEERHLLAPEIRTSSDSMNEEKDCIAVIQD